MAILFDLIGWLLFCAGFCAAYIGVVYFPARAKEYMKALAWLAITSVGGWMAMSIAAVTGYGQEWFVLNAAIVFGGIAVFIGALFVWTQFLRQTHSP